MITRRPKLRRQKKIFRQQGKMPRPDQLNINVATWGRLLKRNLNFQKSLSTEGSSTSTRSDSVSHNSGTGNFPFFSYNAQWYVVGRGDKTYFEFCTFLGNFDHANIEKLGFFIFGQVLRSQIWFEKYWIHRF